MEVPPVAGARVACSWVPRRHAVHTAGRRRPCCVQAAAQEAPAKADTVMITEVQGKERRRFPADRVAASSGSEPAPGNAGLNVDVQDFVQSFFLPRGFPDSCTDDYLGYQLRALPTHVTGWMSKSLATSSLIHALGVGAPGAGGAVAATAAIKWITKDGLGAFGRFLVGGRLGGVFDEDPRRWRMIAVGFATVGLALEIATTAFPAAFLLLAGAGNLSKAVGKGLSAPCYRLVQNHFAAAANLGDISAKEQVWEVTAELTGLAASVLLLRAIEANGQPEAVLGVWAFVQVLHVALRYTSLSYLRFEEINQKRGCLLVAAHVRGDPVPSIRAANEAEPMLAGPSGVAPHVRLGAGVEAAFGGRLPPQRELQQLRRTFAGERFWLVWRGGRGHALLAPDCTPQDVLRLLWQAAWLDQQHVWDAGAEDYGASLAALRQRWPDFQRQLREQRWDVQRCIFRTGDTRVEVQ